MTSTTDISNVFTNRCLSDPQGVIRDLVEQTTLQAKDIRSLRQKVDTTFTPEEIHYLIRTLVGLQNESDLPAPKIEVGILEKLKALAQR